MPTITLPPERPRDAFEAFGQLCARDRLDTDDLKVLTLVEAAGESLYQSMAALSDNGEIQKLLNSNGREEKGHAHRILRTLQLLTGEQYELPEDSENPFIQPAPFEELSTELMEMFIQGEIDGEMHYNRWAEHEPNQEVAKIYRHIGADERRHSERDEKVLAMLQG